MQLLWAWVYPDRDRGNHRALELPLQAPKKLGTVALILKIGICRGRWGGRHFLKKPGFLSLGFLVPLPRAAN
jgi:hypothetical protein